MASICSVTFIDASSAPIPAPARPLTTRPVMIGPVSWITENTIAAGSSDLAPNRVRLYRASKESTTPVAAPAKATSGRDFDPISSSCRKSSPNSNGGVTAARTTCQKKMPRSPNHSKNSLINLLEEFKAENGDKARFPGLGERRSSSAVEFASVTGLNSGLDSALALRAHCSSACDEEGSEARYRKIPGRCFHPRIRAWCSYPSGGHPCRRNGRDTMHTRQSSSRHKAQ